MSKPVLESTGWQNYPACAEIRKTKYIDAQKNVTVADSRQSMMGSAAVDDAHARLTARVTPTMVQKNKGTPENPELFSQILLNRKGPGEEDFFDMQATSSRTSVKKKGDDDPDKAPKAKRQSTDSTKKAQLIDDATLQLLSIDQCEQYADCDENYLALNPQRVKTNTKQLAALMSPTNLDRLLIAAELDFFGEIYVHYFLLPYISQTHELT